MGAAFLKCPELMLAPDEAERLAESVARINELYDFAIVSEKTAAWIRLAFVGASIYGPRMVAISNRVTEAKTKIHLVQ
jgi:hypothetical protein